MSYLTLKNMFYFSDPKTEVSYNKNDEREFTEDVLNANTIA